MRPSAVLTVIAVAILAASAGGIQSEAPRVFVVHSYHETQKGHVVEMTEGIEEALRDSGARIEYFHMDTKRRTDQEWKVQAGVLAQQKADEFKPHVIIAMDDNAQQYFAQNYALRPGAPPIVFSGVNADPAQYGFPRANVTGVLERPNVVESLELLLKITPHVKRMVMLTDDSETTDAFCAYARTFDLPIEVVAYEQPQTFDEWKACVEKHRDHVDAFGLYVIRTIRRVPGSDERVPEEELVAWLNEHGRLPTVGFYDTAAKSGVMCGIAVSMTEQGFAAGQIARGILQGQAPASFKIEPTKRGTIMLNLKTAEALGIDVRYDMIKKAHEVVR